MYPNQSSPGQAPTDPPATPQPQYQPLPSESQSFNPAYLDEIAAPMPQKTMNPFMLWAMIGGALLVVAIFLMVLFSSGGPSQNESLTGILLRAQSLKQLTSDNAKTIKNSKLRAANGSLTTILGGVETEFTTYLTTDGKKPKTPKESPVAAEFTALESELEDARLNERFDTVYAREMTYQMKKFRSELAIVYDKIKSKSFRETLEKEDQSFESLSKDFSQFNEK